MKGNHLLVLFGLLVVVLLLHLFGVFRRHTEGFTDSDTKNTGNQILQLFKAIPRCPPGFTFFNGPDGVSMCCKGTVNPYTHTCTPTTSAATSAATAAADAEETMCAFTANVPDPRAPKGSGSRKMLPLCSSILTFNFEQASNQTCPAALPFYAEDGSAKKCCKTNIVGTASGFDCIPADLADKSRYCVVDESAVLKSGEQRCSQVGLLETAECPKEFQKIEYVLGKREAAAAADLKGLKVSACFQPEQSCFPDKVVQYVRSKGGFKQAPADAADGSWKYACSTLEAKMAGKEIKKEVTAYP